MVPIVALKIAEGIEAAQHPLINLKGYISGNPVTGALIDGNSRVSYSHGMGILSDELFEAIQRSCPGEDYKHPKTGPCIEQIELLRGVLDELMMDNFLTPKCEVENSWPVLSKPREPHRSILERKSTELQTPPHVPDITCSTYTGYLAYHWANDKDVRKALHVKEGTVKEWLICRSDFSYDFVSIPSSIPYHHGVIKRGYRVLIMSGDHDILIPYSGTLEWIESLNLSTLEPWRSWHVDGQVGGYTARYSKNLTFATVKGGGHEPAKDMSKESFALFRRWISLQPL
ncbi:Serine carboxypeptidase-like 18 [Platanthera guangdongensis]|uniref:Serine carboxypeptidase-like 18 n=1 Tax=Platanthera guangdongensis TaxID=2320717 RepID=A0ABR2M5A3_9ASPA